MKLGWLYTLPQDTIFARCLCPTYTSHYIYLLFSSQLSNNCYISHYTCAYALLMFTSLFANFLHVQYTFYTISYTHLLCVHSPSRGDQTLLLYEEEKGIFGEEERNDLDLLWQGLNMVLPVAYYSPNRP